MTKGLVTCPSCGVNFPYEVKRDNSQLEELVKIKKPLLVLAGPGTGKTYALAYKIKHLMKNEGARKNEIAVITFTNEAAINMRKTISSEGDENIYIEPESQPSTICTMHKLCYDIVREHYAELGFSSSPQVISSQELKEILIKDAAQLIGEKRMVGKETIFCRQHGECAETTSPKCTICSQYRAILKQFGLIDHDDQTFLACKLLRDNKDILKKVQSCARYLLVDEYQDINHAQWEFIKLLTKGNTGNLFVVGDSYQSIYGFRGGNPKFVKSFTDDYAPDAVIRSLLTSWRCPENISKGAFCMVNKYCGGDLEILNKIKYKNKSTTKIKIKGFDHHNPEAAYIAGTIKSIGPVYEYLILIPSLSYAKPIKLALRRKFINFSCEYDLEETDLYLIRLLLGWLKDTSNSLYLRLLVEEIINRATTDIPAEEVERVGLEESKQKREDALRKLSSYWVEFKDKKQSLYQKIKTLKSHEEFKKLVGIITEIRKIYDAKADVATFVAEMMEKLRLWRSIQAFEGEMNSVYEEVKDQAVPIGNFSVRIMTMKKAKGLQADFVFLVGLENNVLPHEKSSDAEKEEESRLFYVSMTRAKRELFLFHSKARDRNITKFQIAGRSEFIDAIPKEYIEEI